MIRLKQFQSSVMTYRILLSKYRTLNTRCNSVANLLTKEIKWQSHAAASASSATLATSKQRETSSLCTFPLVVKGPLLDSERSADASQLSGRCSRYHAWQSSYQDFGYHCGSNRLHNLQIQQQQVQQRCSYSTAPRGSDASDSPAGAQVAADSAGAQLSQKEKLKRAVKEYGSTVIVFHITISLASLGGFYLAVSSGIDMVSILKNVGVGEAILQSKLATGTGTFVVAYAVHKVFAPVRIGITLTSTPFIVRYLRSKGVLKPPKTKG